MGGTGVIDHFLEVFTRYIDSGFGLLGGDVGYLATTLVAIDITLAALFWSWGTDEDIIARLVKKTLFVGVFAYLIGNWNNLARIVFESFAGLGLKASGATLSSADFLRPGRIAQVGLDAGRPLLDLISNLMGYVSFFENFVQIVVLLFAWVVVLLAFFILAIQLFVTLIEFKLTTLAGFVLIPFGLFRQDGLRGRAGLGNLISSGIKVLVLAVIIGIGSDLVLSSSPPASAVASRRSKRRWRWCSPRYRCSASAFSVPGIATAWSLVARNSARALQFGTGPAAGGMVAAGGAAAGLAAGGVGALAGGVAAAARGGAAMAEVRPLPTASARRESWAWPGVASGLGGVARAAGSAATSPLRRAAANMKSGFSEGGKAAFEATGGSSTMGSIGGPSTEAATSGAGDAPPAWARRMKRSQALSHGATAAAHAVRSGDSHGGGSSINLSESDR